MSENNLQRLLRRAQEEAIKGKLPSYIPLLAQVDRQAIAIAIYQVNKEFQGDYQLNKLNMALAGHIAVFNEKRT